MRRFVVLAIVMALAAATMTTATTATTVAAAPAAASSSYCGIAWGSRAKATTVHPDSLVVDARVGRHGCFDRLVLELDGDTAGYRVEYVDRFVPDASGRRVTLRGGAALQVTMTGVQTPTSRSAWVPASRREMLAVHGFPTFRQAYWGGVFEGTSVVGLGVRARLPFRVFTLDGPGDHSRLVVDVAHRW